MKRKLTLLLSAVMATSCLPMTAYAANFKDINTVPWASETINSVADKGLLNGYEDGTFRGANNVTYCEAMQMLYNTLVKSGLIDPIDAVTAYSYMSILNAYKVPSWCQMAVAYGLNNNIIDMQLVATKFAGGTQAATREDVANMFGQALAVRYDVDGKSASATEFRDFYAISSEKAPLVDLLKRLGIVSGDNNSCFNPQKNINRAEMAVVLNKTYGILAEGIGTTATITSITSNEGKYFYIEVEEEGSKNGYYATTGYVNVYDADGKEMALSRLSKGDEVRLERNGDTLTAIHVIDGVSAQSKYDITGYITSMKDKTVTVENENTGESDKYIIDNDCICYLDGVKVSRSQMEDAIKENYNLHAYAGMMVEVEREKNDGVWEYVTEVTELHVTFSEDYTATGKVDDLNGSRVKFKPTGSSNTKEISFADDCEFYWEGTEVDLEDLIEEAEAGTTYVKVTVNSKDKATEVYLSSDAYEEGSTDAMEGRVLKLEDLSEKKIKVSVGSKDYTYNFDSSNPIENIKFYLWDSDDEDGDWDDGDEDDAIEFVDKYDSDKLYCQLDFNSGGKISSIEISRTKKAWSSDDDQNERKGTVAELEDGILKFTGSNTEYKMLNQYNAKYNDDKDDDVITGTVNGKTVKNPLEVLSSVTSSLKVFQNMANDDDLTLYAEIISDSDNKVQSVEARLTKAEGKMVEFVRTGDEDAPYIKIQTGDAEYKLKAKKSPKLTDEDEDYFNLEDIEDKKYAGEKIELGFNSSGIVDTITVVDGPKNGSASTKVAGIATAANDGLKIKGNSTTYKWLSKTSDITIKNYSGPTESLATIKKMIEDDALEVYVEARLDDKDRVESISVYVKSAVGEIDKDGYDEYLRIVTEDGNKFSFDVKSAVVIDIDDYDEDDLEKGKADGVEVTVKFGDDGRVSKIAKAE